MVFARVTLLASPCTSIGLRHPSSWRKVAGTSEATSVSLLIFLTPRRPSQSCSMPLSLRSLKTGLRSGIAAHACTCTQLTHECVRLCALVRTGLFQPQGELIKRFFFLFSFSIEHCPISHIGEGLSQFWLTTANT